MSRGIFVLIGFIVADTILQLCAESDKIYVTRTRTLQGTYTVNVILSESQLLEYHIRFTVAPINPFSEL